MACFQGTFRSETLRLNVHLAFTLPDGVPARGVLLQLHGLKGGYDDWVRYSNLERYAAEHALAVFMPEVQRSWYVDMAAGLEYFTFVSEELPRFIAEHFRLPVDREHLYVGGQSMGGFGAMKCALTYPDRFAGCLALSARHYLKNKLAIIHEDDGTPQWKEWQALMGPERQIGPENDLELLAQQAAARGQRPRVYLACGTEDFCYPETVQMHTALQRLGFEVRCDSRSGVHNWDFWDPAIRRGLDWIVREDAE